MQEKILNSKTYSFASPEEAPRAFVTAAAVVGTNLVDWNDTSADIERIQELYREVDPGRDYIISYTHVEQTARQIFGPDIVVEHQNVRFTDFPNGGLYAISGFGLMHMVISVLLSYQDTGDTYEAQVVYVIHAYGEDENRQYAPSLYEMGDPTSTQRRESVSIPPDDSPLSQEALDFLRAQPVHRVTLHKGPDDSLTYWQHILPEGE